MKIETNTLMHPTTDFQKLLQIFLLEGIEPNNKNMDDLYDSEEKKTHYDIEMKVNGVNVDVEKVIMSLYQTYEDYYADKGKAIKTEAKAMLDIKMEKFNENIGKLFELCNMADTLRDEIYSDLYK